MWFITEGIAYNLSKMRKIQFIPPCDKNKKESNESFSVKGSGSGGCGSDMAEAICTAINDVAANILHIVSTNERYAISKEMIERGFYSKFCEMVRDQSLIYLFDAVNVISKEELQNEVESHVADLIIKTRRQLLLSTYEPRITHSGRKGSK